MNRSPMTAGQRRCTAATARPETEYIVHEQPDWITLLLTAIDRRDWPVFAAHLADDVEFRYGGFPAAHGRAEVLAAAAAALAPFTTVRHELREVWSGPGSWAMEGSVTYGQTDGGSITLPFVNVFRMAGSRIREYHIHIDPTPLRPAA